MSFAFERSVRSSAILGLVGAGGIGFILTESMEMFMWPRAATIIISMLILVFMVEKASAYLRKKMI
jgi:phosphonate transport system permease protein